MTGDMLLSREHFRIENQPPLCHLLDLGSTNGTKVNGLRVERVQLREGDVITAGDSSFVVHFRESSGDLAPMATCAGCGQRTVLDDGDGPLISGELAPASTPWLCPDCRALRLKFPKTHPDYLIEDWIGGGGMGEVFRARQLTKNRPVAIKMMSANCSIGDKATGYFQREIEVLRDLLMPSGQCHPSIVAFYELFEIDGQFQLVMEYVDGKNALEWVNALKQPLPISSAAQIGRHLLHALDYAHSKGYVHRDVKPSNLLVLGPVHRPRVKLSDFGLAKSFDESDGFATLTRQGDVGGSIGFISPDHIRDFRETRARPTSTARPPPSSTCSPTDTPTSASTHASPAPTRSSSRTLPSRCGPSAPTPPRPSSASCSRPSRNNPATASSPPRRWPTPSDPSPIRPPVEFAPQSGRFSEKIPESPGNGEKVSYN